MKSAFTQSTLLCLPLLVYALGTTVSDSPAGAAASALDRYAAEYLGLVADLGALSPESVDFHTWGSRCARQNQRHVTARY